jgi:RimJ/RimL family protein N-acetyltransferase
MLMLRKVRKDDSELLYYWANDRDVRDMSVNQKPIFWQDHVSWLKKKLADNNLKMFILLDGVQEVGQIRLEYKEGQWIIGYSISAEFRGKGYGKRIVELGLQEIDKGVIIAFVKPSNKASLKIFSDLGFDNLGLTENQGVRLVKFTLGK